MKSLVNEGVAFEVRLEPFNMDEVIDLLIRIQEDNEPISAKCLAYFQCFYSPQSLLPYLEKATALDLPKGI